jgi:hypothetical protein
MVYPAQAAPQPASMASAPPVRQPVVRGKSLDETTKPKLPAMPSPQELGIAMPKVEQPSRATTAMPSPEELGVSAAHAPATPGVDWTATHARLEQLKATSFALSRVGEEFQFTVLLASGQADTAYRIEGRATTEAEAVRVALQKASETCR